jgi:hypothetical protein
MSVLMNIPSKSLRKKIPDFDSKFRSYHIFTEEIDMIITFEPVKYCQPLLLHLALSSLMTLFMLRTAYELTASSLEPPCQE